MSIEAVVFDLDGTLVDTLDDIADSMNAALVARGRAPHPVEAYASWIGEGVAHLAGRALGGGTPEQIDALVTDYRAHNAEHMLARVAPFDGIAELLDALAERGIALGVLSNKTDGAAQRLVAHVFPGRFRVVLGQLPTHAPKPDPAGARLVCAALGVAPPSAILVGDTEIDVATARAAGMRGLAATWGMRPPDVLRDARPYALVEHPLEVLRYLER